jgi:hypothetical protein
LLYLPFAFTEGLKAVLISAEVRGQINNSSAYEFLIVPLFSSSAGYDAVPMNRDGRKTEYSAKPAIDIRFKTKPCRFADYKIMLDFLTPAPLLWLALAFSLEDKLCLL